MLGWLGRLRKDLSELVSLLILSLVVSDVWLGGGGEIPQDSSRNVTTSPNGYHQVRVEGIDDFVCGGLAEFVDLL